MNDNLTASARSLIQYMKDEIGLTIVMAAILALIVALAILLIIQISKEKKKKAQNQAEPENEPQPQESEKDESEESSEAETLPEESDAETLPEGNEKDAENAAPSQAQTISFTEEESMKQKQATAPAKPAGREKPKAAAKPAIAAAKAQKPVKAQKQEKAPAKPAVLPSKASSGGKWVVFSEERGGFGFKLVASNGEVMLLSGAPYASLQSAKSGIKTYQDNVKAGRLEIAETKSGSFFVKINNASGRLLAMSADYKTRSSAESAAESIKRWAETTQILVEEGDGDKK